MKASEFIESQTPAEIAKNLEVSQTNSTKYKKWLKKKAVDLEKYFEKIGKIIKIEEDEKQNNGR